MGEMSLLNSIVDMEWLMMEAANNSSDLVTCQRDEYKFKKMRKCQFEIWSIYTLESYNQDLLRAIHQGRNLIREKYAYMMENIYPEYYPLIENNLPPVSKRKLKIIENLTNMVLEDEVLFRKEYPLLVKDRRPIFSKDDIKGWISVETYLSCKLKTYSIETLFNLKTDYIIFKGIVKI